MEEILFIFKNEKKFWEFLKVSEVQYVQKVQKVGSIFRFEL